MPANGITIRDDGASDLLERLLNSAQAGRFKKPIGEAGARTLKDHFADRNLQGPHNAAQKLGATPSGLFEDFFFATSYQDTADGVALSVNHPAVRQRFLGGDIRPVNVANLTIPAQAAAYGVRARDSGITLKFMFAPNELGAWRPALVAPEAVTKETGKARKDGTRRRRVIKPSGIWYWLVKKVTQRPDPSTLPTEQEIQEGIRAAVESWANGILNGNN